MFTARLGRMHYLLGYTYSIAPIIIAIIGYAVVSFATGTTGAANNPIRIIFDTLLYLIGALGVLVLIVMHFSLTARRWLDLGKSPWLCLLQLIPYVGGLIALVLLFIPGNKGSNKYGKSSSDGSVMAVLFARKSKGARSAPELEEPERISEQLPRDGVAGYVEYYYSKAVALAARKGYASPALFQRELKVSYQVSKAILDKLESEGVIGSADGARPRKVIV